VLASAGGVEERGDQVVVPGACAVIYAPAPVAPGA
jgi:hypothetical protein